MDEEIIADFKQFITSTVSQHASDLRGDIREMRGGIKRLDQKIDDLSMSVAEAIETTNDETYKQLQTHDSRIKQLEDRAL